MTLQTLLRELSELPPRARVYVENNILHVGKDYTYTLPTKFDREIARVYEERNDVDLEAD